MAACSAGSVTCVKQNGGSGVKPWQQRLLGKHLVRCNGPTAKLLTTDLLEPTCEVLGVYFSFVNPGAGCDDFTRHLVDLYSSVNKDPKKKRFEVVHVLLWTNVHDVLDLEESFRKHVADLAWLAVPCDDYERKVSEVV